VDGTVAHGHAEIDALYGQRPGDDAAANAPTLYEQGREDTELVKRDGRWLITRRYISSDSGLPDRFDATWEARGNPLEE
jgi:hypothetical protein